MSILKERGLFEGPVDKLARQSFPGMAHFAGTSPTGTCRECEFWERTKIDNKDRAACRKYQQITNQRGANVPGSASACKYYSLVPSAHQLGNTK